VKGGHAVSTEIICAATQLSGQLTFSCRKALFQRSYSDAIRISSTCSVVIFCETSLSALAEPLATGENQCLYQIISFGNRPDQGGAGCA
tara:strand:+ start:383 stop:649 length:267 start_codon:yes stop_codon:yes gene_type:complete